MAVANCQTVGSFVRRWQQTQDEPVLAIVCFFKIAWIYANSVQTTRAHTIQLTCQLYSECLAEQQVCLDVKLVVCVRGLPIHVAEQWTFVQKALSYLNVA